MVTTEKSSSSHLYIEEWMSQLGLKDEVLAGRLGTSRVTMWRWRTEQQRLNPEKIAALARAMGLEPEDLWRPPSRPSVDALLKDAPDDLAQKAADLVGVLVRADK